MNHPVFGPKRDEVTEEWRKLHNEEIFYLYSLSNIVRVIKSSRMRWTGHVARMGERRSFYRLGWGNLRQREHLEDPGLDWEDNIKMDLQEVGCGGMDWIDLAQYRDRCWVLANVVMKLRVP